MLHWVDVCGCVCDLQVPPTSPPNTPIADPVSSSPKCELNLLGGAEVRSDKHEVTVFFRVREYERGKVIEVLLTSS